MPNAGSLISEGSQLVLHVSPPPPYDVNAAVAGHAVDEAWLFPVMVPAFIIFTVLSLTELPTPKPEEDFSTSTRMPQMVAPAGMAKEKLVATSRLLFADEKAESG